MDEQDPRKQFIDAYNAPDHARAKGWGAIIVSSLVLAFMAQFSVENGTTGSALRQDSIEQGMEELSEQDRAVFDYLETAHKKTTLSTKTGRQEDFLRAVQFRTETEHLDTSDSPKYKLKKLAREYRSQKTLTFVADLAGLFALLVAGGVMISGVLKLRENDRIKKSQARLQRLSKVIRDTQTGSKAQP